MKKIILILVVLTLVLSNVAAEKLSFSTTDLSGKKVDDSIFKETKLTMVNIWGTFCPPCIAEMPDLARLNNDIDDFQVVGFVLDVVSWTGKTSAKIVNEARSIIMKTGAAYTNLVPSKDLLKGKFRNVQAVPTTYFVNAEGEIVGEYLGSRDYGEWKRIINSLI